MACRHKNRKILGATVIEESRAVDEATRRADSKVATRKRRTGANEYDGVPKWEAIECTMFCMA